MSKLADELERLWAAASPLCPWRADFAVITDAHPSRGLHIYDEGGHSDADAALIVAAVNNLPVMIAALRLAGMVDRAVAIYAEHGVPNPIPSTEPFLDAYRKARGA